MKRQAPHADRGFCKPCVFGGLAVLAVIGWVGYRAVLLIIGLF